jgi:hypothetical protein
MSYTWCYKTKNQYKYESNTFIFENIRITNINSTAEFEPNTKYHKRTVATKFLSNVFVINKTNLMHQFHKFILSWNSTCFGEIVCPSSGVYSPYTQQWYMSSRFVDSFRAGPGWNCSFILVLL